MVATKILGGNKIEPQLILYLNDPNKTDPKVNNLIQTFQPRKRKRIGPDMVLKKKEKPSVPTPPATPVTPIVAPIIAPAPPSPIKKPRGRPKRTVKEESESNVSDTDNDSSTDSGEFQNTYESLFL